MDNYSSIVYDVEIKGDFGYGSDMGDTFVNAASGRIYR